MVVENPGARFQDIARITGERWKNLNEAEKKKYEDMMSKYVTRYACSVLVPCCCLESIVRHIDKRFNEITTCIYLSTTLLYQNCCVQFDAV